MAIQVKITTSAYGHIQSFSTISVYFSSIGILGTNSRWLFIVAIFLSLSMYIVPLCTNVVSLCIITYFGSLCISTPLIPSVVVYICKIMLHLIICKWVSFCVDLSLFIFKLVKWCEYALSRRWLLNLFSLSLSLSLCFNVSANLFYVSCFAKRLSPPTEWPDAELKSSPICFKSCPKIATVF